MPLQPSKLLLYSRPFSECSARVRIASALKNIPLTIVQFPADSKQLAPHKDPDYLKKNPNGTVPTLEAHYEDGESLVLTQSLSMLEFLEDSYPGGSRLIPPVTDMAARCRVRDLALLVACDTQPLGSSRAFNDLKRLLTADAKLVDTADGEPPHIDVGKIFRTKKPWTFLTHKRTMRIYEAMAEESAGRFSVGDDVSIADVCLMSLVQQSKIFGRRYDKTTGFPTIERIVSACEGIDAFRHQGVQNAA